jgi:hypothetical protein
MYSLCFWPFGWVAAWRISNPANPVTAKNLEKERCPAALKMLETEDTGGNAPINQNTEEANSLGAQDAMAQRSLFSDVKADEVPEHDSDDDSNADSKYEEATLHDLEDTDGQLSPLRKP